MTTNSILLKVIRMVTKRLYLIILLLSIGCQQPTVSAEKPSAPVNGTAVEAELSKELKIYKNTLFEGKNEQIRIDAASVMLFSDELAAREILLDALRQSENSAARVAVCKALSQTRTTQETITRKEDFIQPLLDALASEADPDRTKLIAEATLIFQYEQIEKPLERIVTNPVLPRRARLNAIYALKLQPDLKAIFKLVS